MGDDAPPVAAEGFRPLGQRAPPRPRLRGDLSLSCYASLQNAAATLTAAFYLHQPASVADRGPRSSRGARRLL
jgi:hypothetical protein